MQPDSLGSITETYLKQSTAPILFRPRLKDGSDALENSFVDNFMVWRTEFYSYVPEHCEQYSAELGVRWRCVLWREHFSLEKEQKGGDPMTTIQRIRRRHSVNFTTAPIDQRAVSAML